MTEFVMLDSRVFVSGADLSGYSSKIEIGEEAEAKKTTNFRSGGAEELLAGISKLEINGEGQWDVGTGVAGAVQLPDDSFWNNRRVLEPWTVGPNLSSDTNYGATMYLTKALRTKAVLFGEIGEVAKWEANAQGTWPLVRGVSAHPSGTPRTASGNGTATQVGAVPDAQTYLYANLHVLSIAGTSTPTLTVQVESDNAVGFPSTTVRGAFAAATTVSGQAIRIAGPFTDDWWRVTWTITGTNPSFLFLVSMGIE